MKIFYYTSTGNSLAVAKKIGGTLYSIPQVLQTSNNCYEDDKIGIIFPAYYWSTPTIVEKFLQTVTLEADYIFAVATYGNIAGGVLHHIDNLAKKNNIHLSYSNKILMIDNYIELYNMDKQIRNVQKKNIDAQIENVVADINKSSRNKGRTNLLLNQLSKAGNYFYKKAIGNCDKNFYVENNCTACGICSRVCPVKNITLRGKPEFNHNCIHCFACTHNCPENAIRNKKEKSKARFRNENVTLKEIIDANNQEHMT